MESEIGRIIAVGRTVFVDNPAVAAEFRVLAPRSHGRRLTPAPGATGEAGEAGAPAAATLPMAAE